MDDTSDGSSRRRFLQGVAGVTGSTALAGCSAVWHQTGATDVNLYNWAGEPKVVLTTITARDADEPHTDRTLELGAGERIESVNRSKLPTNTSYTVEVTVEDGPSETFD